MNPMPVTQLRRSDVGARVIADPQTSDGPIHVEGVIRWITFTSNDVTLAIEDEDDVAVEWTFDEGETVQIGAQPL